jgi:hypothetical protein
MATQSTDVLPAEEANAIAALDEAKRQIDIARANEDIDSLLEWQDRAAAVQHYIRRRDEARELADNAGEIKVRAEAALGKLDLAVAPARGRRAASDDTPEEPPLAGFASARRSAYRVLGKLAPGELDEVVGRLRSDEDSDKGVTTARAVQEARAMLPKEERAQGEVSKDERKELVTDYAQHLRALDTQVSLLTRLGKKIVARATDTERGRLALRLSNDIVRLEDLRDFLAVDGVPAPEDDDDAA